MAKTSARSLLSSTRVQLHGALSRAAQLPLAAPVQRFARGALRRALRDFPLLGELLELSRVVLANTLGSSGTAVPATPPNVADAATPALPTRERSPAPAAVTGINPPDNASN